MTREKKNHLENKHQSKNVKVSNVGSTFVKTYDIINEVCKFYEVLSFLKRYTGHENESYLAWINTSTVLSENDEKYCENFPTLQEYAEAVNVLDLELMFWKNIQNFLYEATFISHIYIEKESTSTQKCSVLSLIHKKGN